jgi:hypothetical protein
LARGICGSAADRNSSGKQAGNDDKSHLPRGFFGAPAMRVGGFRNLELVAQFM